MRQVILSGSPRSSLDICWGVCTCAQPNIYSDSEATGQIHQLPYKVAARSGQLLVAQGCAVTALLCLLFG